jgi:DNA polymerase III delta prime subunit
VKNEMNARPPRIQGHEEIFERLHRQARDGRLPHAMLFSGPEGIGKRTVAIELARVLLSESDAEGVSRVDRFAHEDLLIYSDVVPPLPLVREDLMSPEISEDDLLDAYRILGEEEWIHGHDASRNARGPAVIDLLERDPDRFLGRRNIPFADVLERELATLGRSKKAGPKTLAVARRVFSPGISQTLYRRNLGIELINGRGDGAHFRTVESLLRTSRSGQRRIVIFDDAHRLTEEAENAFLKTLEEPPPETHLILVTSEPLSLLPTTLSRCARVVFHSLPLTRLETFLTGPQGIERKSAQLLAALAEGSIGVALRLRGLPMEERRRSLESILPAIAQGDLLRVLAHAGASFAVAGDAPAAREPARAEARVFLDLLSLALRDLALVSAGTAAELRSGLDPAFAHDIARRRTPEEWEHLFQRAEVAAEDLDMNVEPRLAVEALFVEAMPVEEPRP